MAVSDDSDICKFEIYFNRICKYEIRKVVLSCWQWYIRLLIFANLKYILMKFSHMEFGICAAFTVLHRCTVDSQSFSNSQPETTPNIKFIPQYLGNTVSYLATLQLWCFRFDSIHLFLLGWSGHKSSYTVRCMLFFSAKTFLT